LIALIGRQIPRVIFLARWATPRDPQCGLNSASKIQEPEIQHIDMSACYTSRYQTNKHAIDLGAGRRCAAHAIYAVAWFLIIPAPRSKQR
jgi:hypothetical protein